MKKALALILAVMMCVALFGACATDSSSSTDTGTTTTASGTTTTGDVNISDVTLNVVTMFGGADEHTSVYKGINATWSGATGVTLVDESAKADGTWQTKVITNFSQGNVPDVLFFFNSAQGQQIIDTGKVVDIDTIRAAYPEYCTNISEGILTSSSNTASDGKVYCVPIKGFAEGIFCNTTLFEKAGVSTSDIATWDGLLAAIEKFKAKDIIPFSVSIGNQPHYFYDYLMLAETGADDYDVTISSLDEIPEGYGKGLDLLKTLYDAGAFPTDTMTIAGDNAPDLFKSQDAAMYVDGSWHTGAYETKPTTEADVKADVLYADDITFVNFPVKNGTQGIIAGYSSGWYITTEAWNDAAKREAAVKYVMAQTSDASISLYTGPGIGGIPASTTVELSSTLSPLFSEISAITGNYKAVFPSQDKNTTAANAIWIAKCADVATGKMTGQELITAVYTESLS